MLQQLRAAAPGDLEVTVQVGAAHASSLRIHVLICQSLLQPLPWSGGQVTTQQCQGTF